MTIHPHGASVVSHQTVRLSRGSHRTPDDGACVMELASMLAGEEFSDHPKAVCPVIAAFLRSYNDLVDDESRQDLYGYAAKAVGTRHGRRARRSRARLCRAFGDRSGGRLRLASWSDERAAVRAARAAADPAGGPSHEAALELVDALIAAGGEDADPVPALLASDGRADASRPAPY